MKYVVTIAVLVFSFSGLAMGGGPSCNSTPLPQVKLENYLGTWYEISRFNNPFQKDCVATSATYEAMDEGTIAVLNECRLGSFEGELSVASGIARATDSTNSKLKVAFGAGPEGDYWILELGNDYEYAVVGEPTCKFLWVLSRTRNLPDSVYLGILDRIKNRGYDISLLNLTPQPQ